MHTLKVLNSHYITHNVKRFSIEKPEDFTYRPGQSAHISLNLPGWEDKIRQFAFTSLNAWPFIEFIVKVYEDHEGVTKRMGTLNKGDKIILHDVFGSIEYKGPGIFIAGGTGITPFISIFRALYYSGNLRDIGLIYSNKSEDDIILGQELFKMLGPAYINVFTQQGVIGFQERRIDREFLKATIGDFDQRFYVCGPEGFARDITKALMSLGADPQSMVI